MLKENENWGHFDIILGEYLEKNGIIKNKISAAAKLQQSQLISYCKNEVQRSELGVLARICCVLKCNLVDIIKYCPPEKYPSMVIDLNKKDDL